jgi:hypothetical protein
VRGQLELGETGKGGPIARPKAAVAALVGNMAPTEIGEHQGVGEHQ